MFGVMRSTEEKIVVCKYLIIVTLIKIRDRNIIILNVSDCLQ